MHSDSTVWAAVGATALDFGATTVLLVALAVLLFPSTRRTPTGVGPGRFLLALVVSAGTIAAAAWTIAHT